MKIQDEVLNISAELWNKFLEIPKEQMHQDDANDVRFHIHAIQNIIFTQLYKLKEKQNMEKQKVFIVQHIRKMMLMGCFKTKQDAETFTNKSKDFFIIESEIQEYLK